MPPSALDRLASLHIDYPMLFELHNNAASRTSHCGVLEFIAEEGMIYMPYWMMENMLLQEGDTVLVKNATLPKGTYVKLQPHTTDFLDISNPKAILETTLRSFSCLTTGDSIMVAYNNKRYYIDIVETKPSNAISIIETDCEVDFAPPLDYKEPEKIVAPAPFKAPAPAEEAPPKVPKFNPFSGAGKRLDGKPGKNLPTPTATSVPRDKPLASTSASGQSASGSSSQSSNRQTKLVFGSKVNQTPKDSPKPFSKPSRDSSWVPRVLRFSNFLPVVCNLSRENSRRIHIRLRPHRLVHPNWYQISIFLTPLFCTRIASFAAVLVLADSQIGVN